MLSGGRLIGFGVDANTANGIDSFTQLMLHGDGTNNGTVFTDSSANAYNGTAVVNAVTTTSDSVFGGSCISIPAAGDAVNFSGANLNQGTSNFTYDFRIKWSAVSGTRGIFSGQNSGSTTLQMRTNGGSFDIFTSGGSEYTSASSFFSTGTWYWLVIQRESNALRVWKDGTEVTTFAGGDGRANWNINLSATGNNYGIGWNQGSKSGAGLLIDEFRYSNTARFPSGGSTISVPSAAYS